MNIDEPVTVDQLVLRRRHHPLLIHQGRPIAIIIGSGEYEMFREREARQTMDSKILIPGRQMQEDSGSLIQSLRYRRL